MSILTHLDLHALLYGALASVPLLHVARAVRAKQFSDVFEHIATSLIHAVLGLLSLR
jgi:hypothetical protein